MTTTDPHTPSRPNDRWTEYVAPHVREVRGERFRYEVESISEPGMHHTVDLTQRGGHGACTCTHFLMVANANFRRHGLYIPYAQKREGVSECKHIRAALDHLHQHVIVPMLASFANGIKAPRP
jgi:hypothetical protein